MADDLSLIARGIVLERRIIEAEVAATAPAVGIWPQAVIDAQLLAVRELSIARDGETLAWLGQPTTVHDWLWATVRDRRPHWRMPDGASPRTGGAP